MARDIEDFLRRAAERRQQQMKQKQGGGAPPPQAAPPRTPARRPPPPPPPKPKKQRLAQVVHDDVEVVDMRDQTISEHVKSHLDTSDIARHAEQLTDKISLTDERVEARIHQKFDHNLGDLELSGRSQTDYAAVVTRDAVSAAAKDILDLIQSPKTIRQAIIMSEILNRPSFDD